MLTQVERITLSKFKTSMLKSSLCDYSDAYILVSGTIRVVSQARSNSNNINKEVVFKNCAPFTDWISEINNTQIDNTKYIGAVPILSLIKCENNYSKLSGSLWQYYRSSPFLAANDAVANITVLTVLRLNLKKKTGTSADGRRKDVKITLPLKYLTWSENCVLSNDTKGTIFAITDTKIDVPIATF